MHANWLAAPVQCVYVACSAPAHSARTWRDRSAGGSSPGCRSLARAARPANCQTPLNAPRTAPACYVTAECVRPRFGWSPPGDWGARLPRRGSGVARGAHREDVGDGEVKLRRPAARIAERLIWLRQAQRRVRLRRTRAAVEHEPDAEERRGVRLLVGAVERCKDHGHAARLGFLYSGTAALSGCGRTVRSKAAWAD